jgi:hypothetical protein
MKPHLTVWTAKMASLWVRWRPLMCTLKDWKQYSPSSMPWLAFCNQST